MGFEQLNYDFPNMPKEMRTMVEREVEKQIKTEHRKFKGKYAIGKTIAASLAAIIFCGTTVFAGVGIYRMQQNKTGEHGIRLDITGNDTETAKSSETALSIPNVRLEMGYLPKGMVQTEQGKYSFEETRSQGGVSMRFFRMDTGDDKFQVQHKDVLASEEFTSNGHQGFYLEYPQLNPDEIAFNQRLYVAFTDIHYVMEMYAASDVSKEEAIKIAEHVRLIPAKDSEKEQWITAENWSSYSEDVKEGAEGEGVETITSVAKEEMKNTRKIGDCFPVDESGLTAKVSDVKITDNLQLLDEALVEQDEALKQEADENGTLYPATIQYIKDGDADTLSHEVSSRSVPQKLVYATVEYTNTGTEEQNDILFFGNLVRIRENDGQMQIVTEEFPAEGDSWDRAVNQGLSRFTEMIYYDVHGGERNNNYITSISPGETAVVHMAWIVTEEELDTLYISLNTSGGTEFTEESLQMGYVDIRR